MSGVEAALGFGGVAPVGEMLSLAGEFGREDAEAVGQGGVIVLIFLHGGAHGLHDFLGALLVAGLRLRHLGHHHVRVGMVGVHPLQSGHFLLSGSGGGGLGESEACGGEAHQGHGDER